MADDRVTEVVARALTRAKHAGDRTAQANHILFALRSAGYAVMPVETFFAIRGDYANALAEAEDVAGIPFDHPTQMMAELKIPTLQKRLALIDRAMLTASGED
jgi:hypothetical protein